MAKKKILTDETVVVVASDSVGTSAVSYKSGGRRGVYCLNQELRVVAQLHRSQTHVYSGLGNKKSGCGGGGGGTVWRWRNNRREAWGRDPPTFEPFPTPPHPTPPHPPQTKARLVWSLAGCERLFQGQDLTRGVKEKLTQLSRLSPTAHPEEAGLVCKHSRRKSCEFNPNQSLKRRKKRETSTPLKWKEAKGQSIQVCPYSPVKKSSCGAMDSERFSFKNGQNVCFRERGGWLCAAAVASSLSCGESSSSAWLWRRWIVGLPAGPDFQHQDPNGWWSSAHAGPSAPAVHIRSSPGHRSFCQRQSMKGQRVGRTVYLWGTLIDTLSAHQTLLRGRCWINRLLLSQKQ